MRQHNVLLKVLGPWKQLNTPLDLFFNSSSALRQSAHISICSNCHALKPNQTPSPNWYILLFTWALFIFSSAIMLWCSPALAGPSGKVVIFHAGSLSVPFKHLEMAVETKYSGLNIQREAAGSRKCARKITDEKRFCDIMVSADYTVIDNLLIPDYADWNVRFASNQIVLCHTRKSPYAKTINAGNWHRIIIKKNLRWGHTDPNLDPCGYRALMVLQLAEKQLNITGLADRLIAGRDPKHVFSSASQMIDALKKQQLDYCWEYLSVAVQHGLNHIVLPDEINLGNYTHDDNYRQAVVTVTGKRPGTTLELRGKSITYGVTLLKDAPNPEGAIAFLQCLFSRSGGLTVLESMGQPPFVPCRVPSNEMKSRLPEKLQAMVKVQP